jgi:phospholipid/cholesterol/gamma-HCH transport system substrate-binding protein
VSQQLGTDIHNTLVATQRALEVLTRTGSGPLVAQTTATLAATERTMARLDTILGAAGAARVDTLTANLARLSTNLSTATASLDTLLGRMSRGEGSLGKLATDSLLYRNLNETLTALTSLLNDLRERPGRYLTVKVF